MKSLLPTRLCFMCVFSVALMFSQVPPTRSKGHFTFEADIGSAAEGELLSNSNNNHPNSSFEALVCVQWPPPPPQVFPKTIRLEPATTTKMTVADDDDCTLGNGSIKFNGTSRTTAADDRDRSATGETDRLYRWQKGTLVLDFSQSWRGSFVFTVQVLQTAVADTQKSMIPKKMVFKHSEPVFLHQSDGTWSSFRANFSDAKRNYHLTLRYRVDCDSNFYGPGCDVRCELSEWEKRSGNHFECSKNDGEKRCAPGWTGFACNVSAIADKCNNCLNGGICNETTETCKCPRGFQGIRCEQCVTSKRCKGFCRNPWECNCPEGYGGQFCEKDLIYCTRHSPCQNDGRCVNSPDGGYTCECLPGYLGSNCENRITDCTQKPCLYGGVCITTNQNETLSTGFRCKCPPGHHGRFCQVQAQGCVDRPCQNGATCVETNTLKLSFAVPSRFQHYQRRLEMVNGSSAEVENSAAFKCLCSPGWAGPICDIYEREFCSAGVCKNGARCVVDVDTPRGFVCHCAPDYKGTSCERSIDDCKPNPCQNNGVCVNGPNSFRCSCPTGFSGELCQNPHDESVNLISCNLSLYSKLLICLAIIASFFLALSIPIYRRRRLARKSLKQSRSSTTTSETSSADPEKHVEAEGKEFRNFVNPKHHPKPAVSFDVDPSTLKTTTLSVVNTCRACEEKNRYVSESFGFGPAPVNPSCDSRRLNSISAWSHHLEEDLHRRRPSYEEVLQPTSTTTIRRHPLQSPPPPPPYDENFYVSHETSNDDGGLRRLFTGPEIVYGGTIAESGIYEEIFSDQPIYYRHHYNT